MVVHIGPYIEHVDDVVDDEDDDDRMLDLVHTDEAVMVPAAVDYVPIVAAAVHHNDDMVFAFRVAYLKRHRLATNEAYYLASTNLNWPPVQQQQRQPPRPSLQRPMSSFDYWY